MLGSQPPNVPDTSEPPGTQSVREVGTSRSRSAGIPDARFGSRCSSSTPEARRTSTPRSTVCGCFSPGRDRRHRPRRPRRHRDRRPSDAPDRHAHEHGPVDRHDARPLPPNPRAGTRRRGRRARPDAGPDAARTRRCAVRDRADDAAPARVRRRRVARAANAADKHPRQPRAPAGAARSEADTEDEQEMVGSARSGPRSA